MSYPRKRRRDDTYEEELRSEEELGSTDESTGTQREYNVAGEPIAKTSSEEEDSTTTIEPDSDEEELHKMFKREPKDASPSTSTSSMAAEAGGTSGGGGGASGLATDIGSTTLNNPFSGQVVVTVPDQMAAPADLTYDGVLNTIKLQHPLITEQAVGIPLQLTVTKVEFYGASAGMIMMTPYVQHQYPTVGGNSGAADTTSQTYYGQQRIDMGSIARRPYLEHNFGNSLSNTRIVNVNPPVAPETSAGEDRILRYQMIQRAATPVPVDCGYVRISFILRVYLIVALDTAFPTPTMLEKAKDVTELRKMAQKRNMEIETMCQIDKVRRLTMPVLDQH